MTNANRCEYRLAAARFLRALVLGAALLVAGCGSVDLVASANIPAPLVTKVPVTVALYLPKEFAEYVHKEERWSTDWNIALGKAQTDGIVRLMNAMFERVIVVDSINAGTQLGGDVRAILEPSVEEYAFVTPRDAGTPLFAVNIKYRVNIYTPDGRLADSWGFIGYGTTPSQGISSSAPLAHATGLALRDAGAKLAVEFREQAIVRGLMPDIAPVPAAPSATPENVLPPTDPSDVPGDAPPQQSTPTEPPDGLLPVRPAQAGPAV